MVASEEGRALTFRRWHKELEALLIQQGLHGGKQKEILRYFKDENKEEVLAYLELLLKEDRAQKFKYGQDYYWRATINILEEPE